MTLQVIAPELADNIEANVALICLSRLKNSAGKDTIEDNNELQENYYDQDLHANSHNAIANIPQSPNNEDHMFVLSNNQTSITTTSLKSTMDRLQMVEDELKAVKGENKELKRRLSIAEEENIVFRKRLDKAERD